MAQQPPWKSISFACGGWLQFYLYGVSRALQAQGLDDPNVTYCGCSAGALAAVGLVCDGDFDAAMDFCKEECVPKAHGELFGLFQLGQYVSKCLDIHLLPKYRTIPVGKLQVAVTRLPWMVAERVVEFKSQEDLRSALLASAAAFPAAPLVYRKGGWCMDGGVTDFQPIIDEDTLTVSPFYFSDCDIKPSRYVPLWWAFLPPRSNETIDWLYSLGFNDAMAYFQKEGLLETDRSRPHIKTLNTSPHPYDVPRRISLHRFLGYDIGNITHEYVLFIMDFILLILLLTVWRPAALLLIYIELWGQIFMKCAATIVVEVYEITPLILFSSIIFYPNIVYTGWISGIMCIEKVFLFGLSTLARKNILSTQDCLLCVFSWSLLQRFFTTCRCHPRDSLRKHYRLSKVSLLYRVFCHMI